MAGFIPPPAPVGPGPCPHAFAITPGASALPNLTRYLIAAGAGTATCTMADGTTGIVIPLAVGLPMPVCVSHVTAATATGIVGLY